LRVDEFLVERWMNEYEHDVEVNLAETCVDLLEWDRGRPEEQRANRRSGMSRERERELLDAWHARGA